MELLAYTMYIDVLCFSLTSSDGICQLPRDAFLFFSQLPATAFEISGPAGPAQRGATAGKPEARVIAVYCFESF